MHVFERKQQRNTLCSIKAIIYEICLENIQLLSYMSLGFTFALQYATQARKIYAISNGAL